VEGRPPGVGSTEPGSEACERELVERARRGDAQAFGELVRANQEVAFRLAYVITGSAAEAEDAAQEAVLKAWRALPRFREGEPLRPWLLTIVANEARNRRRSAGRRERLALRAAAAAAVAPGREEPLLDQGELAAALGRLRHDDRVVIGCRYLLALSEAETAAALGVARGTVKSRLSRALVRLRTALVEGRRDDGGAA
jgi:RNA polymerase sigma-70 factor (ECF subfamily)